MSIKSFLMFGNYFRTTRKNNIFTRIYHVTDLIASKLAASRGDGFPRVFVYGAVVAVTKTSFNTFDTSNSLK